MSYIIYPNMNTNKIKPTATITENNISVYYNGTLYPPINKTHPNFDKVKELIKLGEWEKIPSLLDLSLSVKKYLSEHKDVEIKDGVIYFKGQLLDNLITKRTLELMKEGFSFKHLLNFIEKLQNNPSYRAVQELYKFLEHQSLPITEDGCFLAYKAVRNNYKDIFSGTFDNSIGKVVSIQRNMVDEDKARHCSNGLHVGAITYVKKYGHFNDGQIPEGHNRLMIVKVDPADAVCVPEDHNCTKLRVCKYEVVGEINDLQKILDSVVYTRDNVPMESDSDFSYEDMLDSEEQYECDRDSECSCECDYCESTSGEGQELTGTDRDYFVGREHGIYDATYGKWYNPKFSDSKKYMRGYKNGYESINKE